MFQWSMWQNYLPKVKPYYAVKCNNDTQLLQWLKEKGAGFDCASSREMKIVSELYKNPGDNILFANPCKTSQDIEVAKQLNVPWVTVDSVEELEKMHLANYHPEILLRVAVDDKGSTSPFAAKFGATPEISLKIARAAHYFKMPVSGISFHVGSGSDRSDAFRDAVKYSKNIWNSLQLGPMKVLDLGGGWSSEEKLFKEQTDAVRPELEGLPKVIAEPGRFFAAPIYSLYMRVIGKKPKENGWRYTLDESIYGQFSCVPFDHASPKLGLVGERSGSLINAVLFGRTCDSLDWIANSKSMEELRVGDWLYCPKMGAYTSATSTEFNGFPKPEVIQTDEEPEKITWLDVNYPLAKMLTLPV